jgi:hypothetical protein
VLTLLENLQLMMIVHQNNFKTLQNAFQMYTEAAFDYGSEANP